MQDSRDSADCNSGLEFLNRLRRRAFSSHEEGDLQTAEWAYQQLLERTPGDVQVRQALGILALQTGKYPWALQLLSQVAQSCDGADLQFHLGSAYCGLSRLEEALRCYGRAIAIELNHQRARMHRGQVLQALGRFEEAASAYARAIELGLDCAEVHTLRGVTLAALGRGEESVACFDRALALRPDYMPAHVNLGVQLRKLKAAAESALAKFQRHAVTDGAPASTIVFPCVDSTEAAAQSPARVEDRPTHVDILSPAVYSAAIPFKPIGSEKQPSTVEQSSVLSKWPPRFGSLVLLAGGAPTVASCVLAALLGTELIRAAISLIEPKSPAVIAAVVPAPTHAKDPFDATSIVAAHLFGVVRENQTPQSTAAATHVELKLTGTLATEDPRRGIAIIGGGQGKSQVYSIGEPLDGASLWEVFQDRVILERDGSFESLSLPRTRSLTASTGQPDSGDKLMTNPFADLISPTKAEVDAGGSLLGIRIAPGRDRASFMKSGLLGGDIVVAINGTKLDADRGADALKTASNGSSVTVLRRGVLKDINLAIAP